MFRILGALAFSDVLDCDDSRDEGEGSGNDQHGEESEIAGGDGPTGASHGEEESHAGVLADVGVVLAGRTWWWSIGHDCWTMSLASSALTCSTVRSFMQRWSRGHFAMLQGLQAE